MQLSPTRVILSKLGRIEIYQPIGKEKTPHGPHTHLLPIIRIAVKFGNRAK
jgi:hypothetical protein